MATKNILKINSINLSGFAKRFPKGLFPYRNVMSCKQLNKPTPTFEPDYSKTISKSSATSLVREEKKPSGARNPDRRSENLYAAERVRKCSAILRHQIYQKLQTTNLITGKNKRRPSISDKLVEIMARDVANAVVASQLKAANFERFLRHEKEVNSKDYKPQEGEYIKRWQIKLPTPKHKDVGEKNLGQEDQSLASKRERGANKDTKSTRKIISNDSKVENRAAVIESARIRKMWVIGNREIPRLD